MNRATSRVLPLHRSLAVRLAVALIVAAGPVGLHAAQPDPTETKLRLMAEALRARDAGDLPAAQAALVQPTALAPNDEAARRLRNEIETQAIAQQAALAQQAAARQAAEERAAVEAVRKTFSQSEISRNSATGATGATAGGNSASPGGGNAAAAGAVNSASGGVGGRAAAEGGGPAANAAPRAGGSPEMIDVRLPEPGQPVTPVANAAAADSGRTVTRAASEPSRQAATVVAAAPAPVVAGPLAKKLGEVILPEVNFNRTSLDEAVAWLSKASADNDTAGATPRGTNIVLIDPARRNPPVTLSLRAVTVKRALDFMTESVGFTYEVQDDAIVVRPVPETARYEETRQVELEVRFVEVPVGTIAEVGATWDVLRRLAPADSPAAGRDTITSFVGEFDVTALVRTLTQKPGGELLAAPTATVLSGAPTTLSVLQELRFPESYAQMRKEDGADALATKGRFGLTTVTLTPAQPVFATRPIGVEVRVTPFVSADDRSVTLDLNPKLTGLERYVTQAGPTTELSGGSRVKMSTTFSQPIFTVREISTRVKIPDGATLVLGGLTREKLVRVEHKVPVLSEFPGLGRLFSATGEETQPRDLLIFVTARVVPTAR